MGALVLYCCIWNEMCTHRLSLIRPTMISVWAAHYLCVFSHSKWKGIAGFDDFLKFCCCFIAFKIDPIRKSSPLLSILYM